MMSQDEEESSNEDIRELLKEIIKVEYKVKKEYNKKININNAVSSTLKEFLNNFIIVGYDLNENPVLIKFAKSKMEQEALKSLSLKYMSRLIYENE